ncbi:hypothetical protein SAMN02745166_02566 [Prosthecobacter debontii]|uniref:Uncharacterized protein n=1 Tax=Prosthecobacter debontii TaxID=48467 RepID=A0A1T4Y687_9BACT|nr:hypothetical protein [Prosthecobacter debontii]SKA97173.1 hypothetical protein SAMN02745166_02566 [Prosthecobacter debontii]
MSFKRRFIASLLLMAYAVTGTSLMPATMLILANLDGSHSIQVQESDHGTQLLLHHNRGNYTPLVCDHTGALARVVVSLCRPDSTGDHNLVAAHMSGQANTERQNSKSSVKQAATLNHLATSALILWRPQPIKTQLVAKLRLRDEPQNFSTSQRKSLSTVQLVI